MVNSRNKAAMAMTMITSSPADRNDVAADAFSIFAEPALEVVK